MKETTSPTSFLDNLIPRLNWLYVDEFQLIFDHRKEIEHDLHGKCICVQYRLEYVKGRLCRLPYDDGEDLMKIIWDAGHRELVGTKVRGKQDFCGWGYDDRGAWIEIFLRRIGV